MHFNQTPENHPIRLFNGFKQKARWQSFTKRNKMNTDSVQKYFQAEQNESLLFIFMGGLAILVSIYFYTKVKTPLTSGMALSLILIAIIQLIVGSSVYIRSPKDILRVEKIIQEDPSRIKNEEIPRMIVVMKNFSYYKYLEIAFILISVGFILGFKEREFLLGFGMGLLLQSSIMLVLDLFAEARGLAYLTFLESLR